MFIDARSINDNSEKDRSEMGGESGNIRKFAIAITDNRIRNDNDSPRKESRAHPIE